LNPHTKRHKLISFKRVQSFKGNYWTFQYHNSPTWESLYSCMSFWCEGESIALIISFDVKHPSLRPIPSSLSMFLFYKPTLIKKTKTSNKSRMPTPKFRWEMQNFKISFCIISFYLISDLLFLFSFFWKRELFLLDSTYSH
jgi:hypothetical protein